MSEPTPEQVHEHLNIITNPESQPDIFKNSEAFIRSYLKNRNAIQVLFQIFIGSEKVEVRSSFFFLVGNFFKTFYLLINSFYFYCLTWE